MKPSPVRPKRSTRRPRVPTSHIARRSLPTQSGLPNINILKLMDGFVSFRSTIHDLSQSLQRLESMMDHTTSLFSVGRNIRSGKGPFVPQLPKPPVSKNDFKDEFKDEEIPIIKLPKMPPPRSPFLRLLQYIDMGKLVNILQSPMMKGIFTQMFAAKPAPVQTNTQRPPVAKSRVANGKRRNVRRKRVRP